jgi:Tol biopolymer transport system component
VVTTSRRGLLSGLALSAPAAAALSCGIKVASNTAGAAVGGLVAFAADGNVFTMQPNGKNRRQLTKVPSGALAQDPAWSADGTKILYAYSPPLPTARGPGGLLPLPVTDLYVMDADGSNQKAAVEHDAPGVGYQNPIWAQDGKSVYVTYFALITESNIVKDEVVEVARVPLGGGARTTVAQNAMQPTLARDASRLAYISSEAGGQSLVVADADGKNPKTIVPASKLDGINSPRFSPDGKLISFSATTPLAPVVTPTPARTSFLQPSTAYAAELRHGLPMDVWVVAADGTNLKRLTQLGEDSPTTAWSPDGKQMLILAGGGIYLMNADGSNFDNVDQHGGHGSADWRK